MVLGASFGAETQDHQTKVHKPSLAVSELLIDERDEHAQQDP